MSFLRPIALAIVALCMSAGLANGNEVFTEDFSYADGDLVGNGGWVNHSGTGSLIQVTGGVANVVHGSGSREDAHTIFGAFTSGVLSANFDIVVTDDTAITGGDYEYFAHFMSDGSFNFRSRLDVVEGTGGDYSLGIATSNGAADATLASSFAFGDTVNVTISYDFDLGQSFLTVGSETISGAAGVFEASLDSFALRQSTSSNNETIQVDNVVIGRKVPEPTTAAVLGLGLVAGMIRRRR